MAALRPYPPIQRLGVRSRSEAGPRPIVLPLGQHSSVQFSAGIVIEDRQGESPRRFLRQGIGRGIQPGQLSGQGGGRGVQLVPGHDLVGQAETARLFGVEQ